MKSEALLIGNKNMSDEKKEVLNELLFRMNAVKTAEDKKYVLMNAPKDKLERTVSNRLSVFSAGRFKSSVHWSFVG